MPLKTTRTEDLGSVASIQRIVTSTKLQSGESNAQLHMYTARSGETLSTSGVGNVVSYCCSVMLTLWTPR